MIRLLHIFTILAISLSSSLQAHRYPQALTIIAFNPNTQTTEITHLLHADDVEAIFKDSQKEVRRSLASLEARAEIALYIESQFKIFEPSSKVYLEPELIGAQLEGDTVYVFQEYAKELLLPLKISNTILQDYFSDQINTVNLKHKGRVITAIFSQDEGIKTLDFGSDLK